jgi:amino acid transporter
MNLKKKIFNYLTILTGIFWDFPDPDKPLTYHIWTPLQAFFAWIFVLIMFIGGIWAMHNYPF